MHANLEVDLHSAVIQFNINPLLRVINCLLKIHHGLGHESIILLPAIIVIYAHFDVYIIIIYATGVLVVYWFGPTWIQAVFNSINVIKTEQAKEIQDVSRAIRK